MVASKCLSKLLIKVKFTDVKRARWAKVMVRPEDKRRIVFTKGNPQTSKA
jgi:hypothetical protein